MRLLGAGLAAWSVLLPVARGSEIMRQVQEELRKRKLYFGDVDGRCTEQVAAALRFYQQRKGFPTTGKADENTLRSLALASPTLPETWPDIAVLRSDQGRPNPPPVETAAAVDTPAPTPTPTPGPPPDAVAIHRPAPPSVAAVREFVADYLRAGQANDREGEMRFYGERVDYFESGVVSRRFISNDVTRYDRRWPERSFSLLDGPTLAPSPDGDPEKFVARFRYGFVVKNKRYRVEGKSDQTWVVQRTGPDSLRIVSLKEERVRGK